MEKRTIGCSRRKALQTISAVGAASLGTSIAAGSDDYMVIETDHINNGENIKEEVPIEWYDKVTHAERVMNKLDKKYREDKSVHSIYRGRSRQNIGGFSTPRLKIRTNSHIYNQKNRFPDNVEGFDIDVEVAKDKHYDDHTGSGPNWHGDHYTDQPQGGTTVQSSDQSSVGYGSGLCRVIEDREYKWMTSAHLWDNPLAGGDLWYGRNKGDDRYYIGEISNYSPENVLDFATIDIDDSTGIDSVSPSIEGLNMSVSGHVTSRGIDYLIDNSESVYNFGVKTLETQGSVTGIDIRNGVPDVEVTTNAGGGDSGSPHYRIVDGNATILGIHKYHTLDGNDHDKSYAPAAKEMYRVHRIRFGSY